MPIVPADELAFRRKVRRRLTLDLFTHYGTFWEHVGAIRDRWHVAPTAAVPPEPEFHAEHIGLMTRNQMLEHFHMPSTSIVREIDNAKLEPFLSKGMIQYVRYTEVRRNSYLFMKALEHLWKREVARPGVKDGDWRSGANVLGWMSWAPFLSACVLYDPPADALLEFAEHDDDKAAALERLTVSQDGDDREAATLHLLNEFLNFGLSVGERFAGLAQNSDALRRSYATSYPLPPPRRPGRPENDDLLNVQCAIWRQQGLSTAEIAGRIGWSVRVNQYDPKFGEPGITERSDSAEQAVRRGNDILADRRFKRE